MLLPLLLPAVTLWNSLEFYPMVSAKFLLVLLPA
ncbi:hypothetical protein [Caudoviricetes sp.]|nr:hypothetical protein [Caudoviricetes sp.]